MKRYLLDTTLRDGSFVNQFQYSLDQVKLITQALEKSGVEFIEVNHGCGIGASEKFPQIKARHSDLEYLKTAKSVSEGKIKIGALADQRVTTTKDLEPLYDHLDFVRIVLNLADYRGIDSLIEAIKKEGKTVFLQLSRASMLTKEELLPIAQLVEQAGADIIYVVDSGGFMLPEDAYETVSFLGNHLKVPLGFHGHNNFQMAVANSLAALKAGASYVDGCLHTMGKGAGNAQTEVLAFLLNKKYGKRYDCEQLLECAQTTVFPLIRDKMTSGTQAFELRCAFHELDFAREAMRMLQETLKVDENEILAAFKATPNFFDVTEENVQQVMQMLKPHH